MSKITNNPTISEEKVDIRRGAIRHRAIWMALMFDEMKKAGYDAEGICRRAIARAGQFYGGNFKAKRGGDDSVCSFADAFLADPTNFKTFEMEPARSDEALEIDFHYCPLVTAWQMIGVDEETIPLLCDIAMDGDRNIADANGLTFTLTDTIAAGCPTCKMRFAKK